MKITLCLSLTFFLVSASCNKNADQKSADSETEAVRKSNSTLALQVVLGADPEGNKAVCSYETNGQQRLDPNLYIAPKGGPVPGLIKAGDVKFAKDLQAVGGVGTAAGIVGAIACVIFQPCGAGAMAGAAATAAFGVTSVSFLAFLTGTEKAGSQEQFSGNVSNAVGFDVTKVLSEIEYDEFVKKLFNLPKGNGMTCKNVRVGVLKNPGKSQ